MTGIGLPRFSILSILSIHVKAYSCQRGIGGASGAGCRAVHRLMLY